MLSVAIRTLGVAALLCLAGCADKPSPQPRQATGPPGQPKTFRVVLRSAGRLPSAEGHKTPKDAGHGNRRDHQAGVAGLDALVSTHIADDPQVCDHHYAKTAKQEPQEFHVGKLVQSTPRSFRLGAFSIPRADQPITQRTRANGLSSLYQLVGETSSLYWRSRRTPIGRALRAEEATSYAGACHWKCMTLSSVAEFLLFTPVQTCFKRIGQVWKRRRNTNFHLLRISFETFARFATQSHRRLIGIKIGAIQPEYKPAVESRHVPRSALRSTLRQFIAQRVPVLRKRKFIQGSKGKSMFARWRKLNHATTFAVLSLMTMAPVQAQQAETPNEPAGDAGFFIQSGGTVKRKLAKTRTAATTSVRHHQIGFGSPGATLAYTVPAGTSDLFNVSFTAECRLFNGGADDYVRIRIMDLNTGVPLEPYDGAQAFCSADAYATHTGMWSKRLGAGVHNLQVEFLIFDGAPGGGEALSCVDRRLDIRGNRLRMILPTRSGSLREYCAGPQAFLAQSLRMNARALTTVYSHLSTEPRPSMSGQDRAFSER